MRWQKPSSTTVAILTCRKSSCKIRRTVQLPYSLYYLQLQSHRIIVFVCLARFIPTWVSKCDMNHAGLSLNLPAPGLFFSGESGKTQNFLQQIRNTRKAHVHFIRVTVVGWQLTHPGKKYKQRIMLLRNVSIIRIPRANSSSSVILQSMRNSTSLFEALQMELTLERGRLYKSPEMSTGKRSGTSIRCVV